jgi:hypothetical protein
MLNRVFEDVASFKQQLAEMDVDPDAPALIKSSPSASGEVLQATHLQPSLPSQQTTRLTSLLQAANQWF